MSAADTESPKAISVVAQDQRQVVTRILDCSILDLVPVTEGSDARRAFANMIELARLGERLGFRRYWLAEPIELPAGATIEVVATPAPLDDFTIATPQRYPLQVNLDYVAQ